MNKLREILFWWGKYSWYHNIPVYLRVDFDYLDFNIAGIVLSLVGWSPRTTLSVKKTKIFKMFICNLLKLSIKFESTQWDGVGRVNWKIVNCPTRYIMGHLIKKHKIIPIPWAGPVFPLSNSTMALVGTNIEKYDIKFVTATFLLNLYETTQ